VRIEFEPIGKPTGLTFASLLSTTRRIRGGPSLDEAFRE